MHGYINYCACSFSKSSLSHTSSDDTQAIILRAHTIKSLFLTLEMVVGLCDKIAQSNKQTGFMITQSEKFTFI